MEQVIVVFEMHPLLPVPNMKRLWFVFISFLVLFFGNGAETELISEKFGSPVTGLYSAYRGKNI